MPLEISSVSISHEPVSPEADPPDRDPAPPEESSVSSREFRQEIEDARRRVNVVRARLAEANLNDDEMFQSAIRQSEEIDASIAMTASADPANHGRASVESMDSTHLQDLIELAEEGDKGAQYRLACNFSETPNKEDDAYKWMTKAAEQGLAEAISKLALFHYHGYGVEQDNRKAFDLAQLASEASVAEAMGLLGMMQMLGDRDLESEPNYEEAFKYSSRGALLGDGLAQRSLAKMYSEGLGCEKDGPRAVYWIKKAATRHNVFQHHAQYELGMWYWEGTHVDENKTVGMSWLLSAASGNLPDALLMLGVIFEDGLGGNEQNLNRAAFFYEQAVFEEEPEAWYRLGRIHVVHDLAGNPANEATENEDGDDWSDWIYGIDMLTRAIPAGHEQAFRLLEEEMQAVAQTYSSADEFRTTITREAAEGNERSLSIQEALSVIAEFGEDGVTGLTENEIEALPSKVLDERISGQRCCICLADFEKDEDVRELECKHLFHKDCVDEWLRRNHNCPLCKSVVTPQGSPQPSIQTPSQDPPQMSG